MFQLNSEVVYLQLLRDSTSELDFERAFLDRMLLLVCYVFIPLTLIAIIWHRDSSLYTQIPLAIILSHFVILIPCVMQNYLKVRKLVLISSWLTFTYIMLQQNFRSGYIDSINWFVFPMALFFWLFIGKVFAFSHLAICAIGLVALKHDNPSADIFLADTLIDYPLAVCSTAVVILIMDGMFKKYRVEIRKFEMRSTLQSMTQTYNHHINNPLTIAIGNLRAMEETNKNVEDAMRALERISDVLKKATELSNKDAPERENEDYSGGVKLFKLK